MLERQVHRTLQPFVLAALLISSGCEQQVSTDQEPTRQSLEQPGFVALPDQPVTNAFPTATELRLFVETDYNSNHTPVLSKPNGRLLTGEERYEFESLLKVHTIAPDEDQIGCFIPHHFFRYYDNAGKVIGEVAVCFCCAGMQASGDSNMGLGAGKKLRADYRKLESLVRRLGEPTDVQCGEES